MDGHHAPHKNDLPALDELELKQLEEEIAATKAKRMLELQRKKKQSILMQPYLQKISDADFVPKTAEDMLDLVLKKYGPAFAKANEWENDFIIPEQLKDLYWKLALYFTNDPRMANYGLSPKRGNLIFGNVGAGKTTALKVFENNPLQPFKTVGCVDIVSEYDQIGPKIIDKYSSNTYNEYKSQYYGHQQFGWAFDDLGTEEMGDFYQKKKNVFQEVLMRRYASPATRGPLTHLTTNISDEDIYNKYGVRVHDRIGEYFNIIQLSPDAVSLRPRPIIFV